LLTVDGDAAPGDVADRVRGTVEQHRTLLSGD
jgi:hypothetical protein